MSDSLRPRGLQHARLPCLSPTPGACLNSRPSSRWCHPTISSSVVPFSCLQSFLASGSFPMSQFSASGGQSIGVSALASFLPKNTQGLISFRMDWLDLLAVQGTLKSLLQKIHYNRAQIYLNIMQRQKHTAFLHRLEMHFIILQQCSNNWLFVLQAMVFFPNSLHRTLILCKEVLHKKRTFFWRL